MDVIVEALAAQHAELDALLDGLSPAGWAAPTRCPGWTVADVVLHLAQTDELAVASARGRFEEVAGWFMLAEGTVDDVVDAFVTKERGAGPDALLARWRSAAADERAALLVCDPRDPLPWAVVDLPARTLATTRLTECWIHTGDVAQAIGVELPATDRLWHVARLAWRTLPYAFARAHRDAPGPIDVVLTGPGGEEWTYGDGTAPTTIRGDALEFCLVAARRVSPAAAGLRADGPDAEQALALLRTWA